MALNREQLNRDRHLGKAQATRRNCKAGLARDRRRQEARALRRGDPDALPRHRASYRGWAS